MVRTFVTQAARGTVAVALLALLAGAAFGGPVDDYRLEPGDKVTVTVFGQPQMSGDVTVDGGGQLIMPLIDAVPVANLTVLQAQEAIRSRLANGILQQPSVSVRIAELRPIYVMGDVRTPGAYQFRFGSMVQTAVAQAGGFGPAETVQGTAVSDFLAAEERRDAIRSETPGNACPSAACRTCGNSRTYRERMWWSVLSSITQPKRAGGRGSKKSEFREQANISF
jgi:polysaccharide biosynthesis/export protein